jgi:hypothetical protein
MTPFDVLPAFANLRVGSSGSSGEAETGLG